MHRAEGDQKEGCQRESCAQKEKAVTKEKVGKEKVVTKKSSKTPFKTSLEITLLDYFYFLRLLQKSKIA